MNFPERFSNLPAYAFPRLRALLDSHEAGGEVVHMTIGEPKHAFPPWVTEIIAKNAAGFNRYPPNEGAPELREAFCNWAQKRYDVTLDSDHVMALNGSREGLYNAPMALCSETKNGQKPVILMPNPFYQVYMIGTIASGAEPVFVPATQETGHLPDFTAQPKEILERTVAVYVCSPANPQGSVADRAYWQGLFELAETYDFRIFADECYTDIYRDTPPVGALEVAKEIGADPERLVTFHSLSKRSNLPGLRSGFVSAGPQSIKKIRQLRNYSGAPLPLPLQMAAAEVWKDEAHVEQNRALYREKYEIADRIFGNITGYSSPQAGFFLWLKVPDAETSALKLWKETGVRVLPGSYLAQSVNGSNPGASYIRVALVANKEETQRGLQMIRDCLFSTINE